MNNDIIIFWVGIVTFVFMLLIKLPVKKITRKLAENLSNGDKEKYSSYRRMNFSIIIITTLVAFVLYCFVLWCIGETHFKLCCSLKGAAVAMAFYAVLEQITGDIHPDR